MSTFQDLGPDMPETDPVRKYVLLVLWQAHEDKASELVLGVPHADGSGTRWKYKVDGRWYDMAPFPSRMRPGMVTELVRMAGLSGDLRDGILDERVGSTRLTWKLQMITSEAECILTPVSE